MKANALNKYDAVLTAEERFRLTLAAIARRDFAETARLRATCPRKTYEMMDAEVVDKIVASQRVASCFAVWFLYMEGKTQVALGQFMQHRETPEEAQWAELAMTYMEHLKGTYTGLLRFCEDERLAWREALAWWPPVLEQVAFYEHIFDSGKFAADEEEAASVHSLLRTWWEQ